LIVVRAFALTAVAHVVAAIGEDAVAVEVCEVPAQVLDVFHPTIGGEPLVAVLHVTAYELAVNGENEKSKTSMKLEKNHKYKSSTCWFITPIGAPATRTPSGLTK
jgi:hypothetical protein